jgi:DNA-binding SARP family transcriptional activator
MVVGHGAGSETLESVGRPLELYLLGGFELRCGGAPLHITLAAERLLAFLAIRARPVQRPFVAGSLWADSSEQHSTGSLRSALWRLGRSGHRVIEADAERLRLAPRVQVDLHDVTARAQRLIHGGPAEDGDIAKIVPAVELLPDHYDDWVLVERERYRQLRMHALETLCSHLTSAARYGEAIEAGLAAVSSEPLRESAHRVLIHAHLAEGNRCEAIRQYERYRDLLQKELGLRPSTEITALLPEQHQPQASIRQPTAT